MTCYVDDLQNYPPESIKPAARRYGTRWCHMTADTLPELLAMAQQLKLAPAWIQTSSNGIRHVDLVPSKRAQAIRLGAQVITTKDMIIKAKDDEL